MNYKMLSYFLPSVLVCFCTFGHSKNTPKLQHLSPRRAKFTSLGLASEPEISKPVFTVRQTFQCNFQISPCKFNQQVCNGTDFCISKSILTAFIFVSMRFDLLYFIFEPNLIGESSTKCRFHFFLQTSGKNTFECQHFRCVSFPHV